MVVVPFTPKPTTDTRLERFQQCDEAINTFLNSWREAGLAALEIRRDRLWEEGGFESERAYWVHKSELAEQMGVPGVTYERMLQRLLAAETLEELEGKGFDTAGYTGEKAVRQLRAVPDRDVVALELAADHQETGRPITQTAVEVVAQDAENGLTFEYVQALFAFHGNFKRYVPLNGHGKRQQKRTRYEFEAPGKSAYFESLTQARDWFEERYGTCDFSVGDKVWDTKHGEDGEVVGIVGAFCTLSTGKRVHSLHLELQARAQNTPEVDSLEVAMISGFEDLGDYLDECHFIPESASEINLEEPDTYRGWLINRGTGEYGDLAVLSIKDPAEQWYSAPCFVEPLQAYLDFENSLDYAKQVIDNAIALKERLSGQISLLDIEPEELTPVSTVVVYPPEDEAVIYPATPQQRMHQRLQGRTGSPHDENNTPGKFWAPALEAWNMESFDLDCATNALSTVPARHKFTKEDDALTRSWAVDEYVFLWANWAWSLNEEFSLKFLEELEAGHIDEALVLDKADSRTAWGQRLLSNASAICRVFGYVQFENADRDNGSATFAVDIYYYGPHVDKFYRAYQHLGLITVPVVPELIAE
jgi:hypothetical protein